MMHSHLNVKINKKEEYVVCAAGSSMENEIMTLSVIILQEAMLAVVKIYQPEHLRFHSRVGQACSSY